MLRGIWRAVSQGCWPAREKPAISRNSNEHEAPAGGWAEAELRCRTAFALTGATGTNPLSSLITSIGRRGRLDIEHDTQQRLGKPEGREAKARRPA